MTCSSVTVASCSEASSIPKPTASRASGEPSVAIRILFIVDLLRSL